MCFVSPTVSHNSRLYIKRSYRARVGGVNPRLYSFIRNAVIRNGRKSTLGPLAPKTSVSSKAEGLHLGETEVGVVAEGGGGGAGRILRHPVRRPGRAWKPWFLPRCDTCLLHKSHGAGQFPTVVKDTFVLHPSSDSRPV